MGTNTFNEFLIVKGKICVEITEKNFNVRTLRGYKLYYSQPNVFSQFSLIGETIIVNKTFSCLFYYKNKSLEILTPNFKHILSIADKLTVNSKGIKEFVLFNTPLEQRTFFNEVKRIFNINIITISNNFLSFIYYNSIVSHDVYTCFNDYIENSIKYMKNANNAFLISGGYESRINAAIASFYGLKGAFFTWGNTGNIENILAKKVANKLCREHFNLKVIIGEKNCTEYAKYTGYLSNLQYAFRLALIEKLARYCKFDIIWSGWGDILGSTTYNHPNEILSTALIQYINNKNPTPSCWNKDWLSGYQSEIIDFNRHRSNKRKRIEIVNGIKTNILAPLIYGQVVTVENCMNAVFLPWFNEFAFNAIKNEEYKRKKLIFSKIYRTKWKGELYYRIIKNYNDKMNNIKISKGFYPFLFSPLFLKSGILIAWLQKKNEQRKEYPFDAIEERIWQKNTLKEILDSEFTQFDKKAIIKFIDKMESLNGNDIFEIYKIIQVYWLLKAFS